MKMEGGVHRRRWNKNASLSTVVLFLCIFPAAVSSVSPCLYAQYFSNDKICCQKCFPGYRLVKDCDTLGNSTLCKACPAGQYRDEINYAPQCRGCSVCKANEELVSKCEIQKNTVCRCKKGYYKFLFNSVDYECRACKRCGQQEKVAEDCTPEKNTVCACKDSFHRVKNQCEPYNNCTASCELYCVVLKSKGEPGHCKENTISTICVVVVVFVFVVALLLVAVITHKLTEHFVRKKLLESLSQSSDSTPDPCLVLIEYQEPLNNLSTKGDPPGPLIENEQPSKLPDCVPLEIKISELIYKVLDLVPVLQVKQLVRCLGVKDTDIEQAELDHRSCREAHYQMLRIWAERGVLGGGLLHCSFLQELLGELRKMHLENAAEEIEINYLCQ
ncbi:tumor necrosis factor receptor superfamily member 1A isoform X2 [Nelusetta ayraudi]|uniref:tumor necrosis factor receptor superfamily member 1A isoform X2 n=1 Tax=Nelusetta ayraudi TaxID=303726 RepID=UPI003F6F7445